jgi:hypothetical protein
VFDGGGGEIYLFIVEFHVLIIVVFDGGDGG